MSGAPVTAVPLLSEYDMNMGLATRYLCLTGLVLLTHDHVMSLDLEKHLIWDAPRSFAKYGFLFNRYFVPPVILISFLTMSGFAGIGFNTDACWGMWMGGASSILVSLAVGNGVITRQIVKIWDNRKAIQRLVWTAYALTYSASVASLMASIPGQKPYITWVPLLNTCLPLKISPFFIPSWAVPLAYELFLLAILIWNAIDRPRQSHVTLVRSLQQDGIVFMLVMVCLRCAQVGIAASLDPAKFLIIFFPLWAIAIMTLNRSILAMRKEEVEESKWNASEPANDTLVLDTLVRMPAKGRLRLSSSQADTEMPIYVGRSFVER